MDEAALRALTDDSGGRTELVRSTRDLDPATAGVADELSQQYYLGYDAPGHADGRWHSIRVEVPDTSYRVRARRGYVANVHFEQAGRWLQGAFDYYEISGEARLYHTVGPLGVVAVAGAGAAQATDGQQWSGHRITVETRNLFIGFDAGAALIGAITPAQAWTTMLASDPAGRAESWADEIAAARPDVVGLQEAMLFRTGPIANPAPAETVAFDFVDLLVSRVNKLEPDLVVITGDLINTSFLGDPFQTWFSRSLTRPWVSPSSQSVANPRSTSGMALPPHVPAGRSRDDPAVSLRA